MSEDKLREAAEALRAEAGRAEGLDDDSRGKLESVLGDLDAKLAQPHDAEHNQRLMERLEDGIAHFEVSHPSLTMALNGVLAALSGVGV
jgi:Domain of unknown function (DUF4404)